MFEDRRRREGEEKTETVQKNKEMRAELQQ